MRREYMYRLPIIFGLAVFLLWSGPVSALSECGAGESHFTGALAECLNGGEADCASFRHAAGRHGDAGGCDSWIRVSSAKYGAADQWCSGRGWVATMCNGRGSCSVSLPDIGAKRSDSNAHDALRRDVICGPLSKSRRFLYIGWSCNKGPLVFAQPDVVVGDGGRAILSCN